MGKFLLLQGTHREYSCSDRDLVKIRLTEPSRYRQGGKRRSLESQKHSVQRVEVSAIQSLTLEVTCLFQSVTNRLFQ